MVDTDGGVLFVSKGPAMSAGRVLVGFDRYTLRDQNRSKNDWIADAGAHHGV